MTEKLDPQLDQVDIKQTSAAIEPIRFRDEAINKVKKQNINFNKKPYIFIPFIVSKDSHQKGMKLRVYKGSVKEKETKRVFYVQYWFNGKSRKFNLGKYSQRFGVNECDDHLKKIVDTHTDKKTALWIKDPNETERNNKRIVEKPDTTQAKGYTINETIEAYCGAAINDEEAERGFSKDRKDGHRTAKSCRNWFRYMAGYNHRKSLVTFYDDENGDGVVQFQTNKHLRINKPKDMRDLFRKYPPGRGILKDRQYWNRRKKQTYTIPASKNKSIYDSDLGKSLIENLKPGDIEAWVRDTSSEEVKRDYVKVFTTLWIYARKRGWLGTNPGICPFADGQVYVKKEPKKYEDPYKDIAIEDEDELELFWECTEELSEQFPWKSELHQFMLLTAMRKSESLKMKKDYINFEKGTLFIPRGISKTRKRDEELPIVPELEILLRNIFDIGNRPGLEFYKMKDHPWLFGTRKWGADKYFNKAFKQSHQAHLGGDEKFIPELRALMRRKSLDPNLLYAPKILRKSYITLSQQKHGGRSEITQQMSRHGSIETLNRHYNKPNIETRKGYAGKVAEVFKFIRRRSA